MVSDRRPGVRAVLVVLTAVALWTGLLVAAPAGSAQSDRPVGPPALRVTPVQASRAADWRPAGQVDDRAAGKVYGGLARRPQCPGGFAVQDVDGPAAPEAAAAGCSHGPDAPPAGVDVRQVPTVAELQQAAGSAGDPTAAAAAAVPCYGDGTSGKRVQVVYAVSSDRTDRYDSVVDLVRGYAAAADQAYDDSATRDGGVRHVRWVTDPDCRLTVLHVVLSPSGDDTLPNTRTELVNLGLTSVDRKYLVFVDANVYCGISYVVGDDRPDASNPANSGPTFSRVDSACWSGSTSVAAHELAHALGAVQLSAPHSNGAWHCTDEYDRLCYDDGSGATLSYPCAASQEPLLDCHGDDYFNVAPAPGSWLASHWNLASSAFLEAGEPTGVAGPTASPTATASPAPTVGPTPTTSPTPTADPTPTVTVSPTPGPTATLPPAPPRWTSTLTGRVWSSGVHRYRVRAGAGVLRATLRWVSGHHKVRVVVRGPRGGTVLDRRGEASFSVAREVSGGTFLVAVRGTPGVRYRIVLTRAAVSG